MMTLKTYKRVLLSGLSAAGLVTVLANTVLAQGASATSPAAAPVTDPVADGPVRTKPIINIEQGDMLKKEPDAANIEADTRGKVVEEAAANLTDEPQNIGVILDGSGSMGQILEKNKSKMFFLKKLTKDFVRIQWKLKNQIGVKVYGSRSKHDCSDIYSPIPYSDRSLFQLEKKLERLEPVGMTPLYKTIEETVEEISKKPPPRKVLIVTDGDDTCGGDPCMTADKLKKDKIPIEFFVIALGFSGKSDTLQKLKCLGSDISMANDEQSFSDAMGQAAKGMSGGKNLKVISPNPDVPVYLYKITPDNKRHLDRVFYAAQDQYVEPGLYEAVVGLTPLYKFTAFTMARGRRTTLKVEGEGEVRVNFFGGNLNVQLLNKNNKVVYKFKSDQPFTAATGKYKLRIYKDPFYETVNSDFFVYPKGNHKVDVDGVGVLKVESPNLEGIYVYNSENKLLDNTLTNLAFVMKAGVYAIHVNDKCSFDQIVVKPDKQILVLPCP